MINLIKNWIWKPKATHQEPRDVLDNKKIST